MKWTLLATLLLAGCGGSATSPARSQAEIVIPTQSGRDTRDDAPPPRAEPIEAVDRSDPYLYFVGGWNGLANSKLVTRLDVTSDGRFHIHLPVQQHRPICDLWGKLRVADRMIYFDIEHSTCEAESVGTTLERHVIEKTDDVLVVRGADSKMVVRYTRRKDP